MILRGASCAASCLNSKFYHFNFLGVCPPLQFQDVNYKSKYFLIKYSSAFFPPMLELSKASDSGPDSMVSKEVGRL